MDADLLVFFVLADVPEPAGTATLSPPFGTEDEAREYQIEYGGTVWRFPVPFGSGEVVAPDAG
jgi:nitrous oxide reductase accessory protein NosL